MKILLSNHAKKQLIKHCKKQPGLGKSIDAELKLFKQDRHHPSLRLHKLKGKNEHWSITTDNDFRIIFRFIKEGILIVDLGPHDELY